MEDSLLPEPALGGVDSSPFPEEIALTFAKVAAVQSRSGDPDRPIIVGRVPCPEPTDSSSDEIIGCVIVGPDRLFKIVEDSAPLPSSTRRGGDVVLGDIVVVKGIPQVTPVMIPGLLLLPGHGDEELFLPIPASDSPPILATAPGDISGMI